MAIALSLARALAPENLASFRAVRYQGDTICSCLAEFVPRDRLTIERVYAFLCALFAELTPPPGAHDRAGPLKDLLREYQFYRLVEELHALGRASYATRPSGLLARTIHDLRGGALTSLVGHLDALVGMNDEAEVTPTFFPLVRDQLKIMRNSIVDLDAERRRKDLRPRSHSIDLVVEKWQQPFGGRRERSVEVRVECLYPHGTISECCVESAAIDRIMYNLVSNAARHAPEPCVDLLILPIPGGAAPASLRFVIANRVTAEDAAQLRARSKDGTELAALFAPGVSTTGSGLGLAITAEFVANAYGLMHREDAVQHGYVGAQLMEEEFVVWFHWPLSSWKADPEHEAQSQKAETV